MTKVQTRAAHDWRKALLTVGATLKQAFRNLDESALQIILVVSPDGTLIGTLTDGDIRRGLLRGSDLESSVDPLISRDPMVVPEELSRDVVLQLMRMNKIHQLPVVDGMRRVVGLHVWDDLQAPRHRPNAMVIMAGGLGTRLRPYTEACPKPLLPVGGKPMLEHIIERAKGEGFRHFILAVNYLGHMIRDHFGDGSNWDIQIDYLNEQAPLGTAGAISLLDPHPVVPFLVSNGDIRYGELLDFHVRHEAVATMAVRQYEWQHPFGVVRTNGVDIIGLEEKPIARTQVNAGIYVLDPAAIDALPAGERCDMPNLFSRLIEREARAIVYPMHEPWLDVGRRDDLERAHKLNSGGHDADGK
jgi:dTDP-glucose pyrophosphorylase